MSRESQRLAWLLGTLGVGLLGWGYFSFLPFSADLPAPAAEVALGLPPPSERLGVGRPLPDLVLVDHEGRALTFGALRGQPVWLAFFRGAYCPYCRERLRELGVLAEEVARAGVQLLAVTPDPPAISARLRRDLGLPFPLLSDQGEQAVAALCAGLAHCQLLVDPDGIVRWGALSESWSQSPAPEALLDAARRLGRR